MLFQLFSKQISKTLPFFGIYDAEWSDFSS